MLYLQKRIIRIFRTISNSQNNKNKKKNIRYYDWEPEYFRFSDEEILKRGEFFDFDLKRVVEFILVKEIEKKEKLFLYYSFNGFTFHVPTSELKDTLEVI